MRILEESYWVECYRAWEQPLFSVVYRIVWDASESQDIVQDAFLRCWRKRKEIRVDGFKALIFKTALNLARDRRRRDRIWRFVGLKSTEVDLSHHCIEGTHLPRAVHEAIEDLPEDLRNALLLTELAGMTYAEIAAILGIKEGTVGSRRTRAIEKVRQKLKMQETECNGH